MIAWCFKSSVTCQNDSDKISPVNKIPVNMSYVTFEAYLILPDSFCLVCPRKIPDVPDLKFETNKGVLAWC